MFNCWKSCGCDRLFYSNNIAWNIFTFFARKNCLNQRLPFCHYVFHSFYDVCVTELSNLLLCALLIRNRNSRITLLSKLNAIVWKIISWWLMQYLTQILLIANCHACHFHLPWRTNSLLSANQAKDYVTSQVCVCARACNVIFTGH